MGLLGLEGKIIKKSSVQGVVGTEVGNADHGLKGGRWSFRLELVVVARDL